MGAGVVVSQFLGAKDREGAHTAVHTSLALSAILGAILTVCGIAVSRALLTAMNTPAEVLEDAVLYMRLSFGRKGQRGMHRSVRALPVLGSQKLGHRCV